MACYHKVAVAYNGMLVRDEPVWFEHVFKNRLVYYYRGDDTGDVEGYIIYRYNPHAADTEFLASDLIVSEMIWLNERALKGLLGFLSSQHDQIGSVDYYDHFNLPMEQLLNEPIMSGGHRSMILGAETAWIGSGLMGRIVQLRKVLTQGKFGEGRGKVTLKVKDELQPGNAGQLTVEFDDGGVELNDRRVAELTMSTDIATFSSIYWGALSLRDARYLGMVEIEGKGRDASFLDTVFSFPKSVCLDYF
ncbi:MAG TPA: hypothetical protein ENL08_01130 [Bacteroidetes bacterium]|nr:hypothetical protein [Bacteroidota bacterium]